MKKTVIEKPIIVKVMICPTNQHFLIPALAVLLIIGQNILPIDAKITRIR
ncbi:hypothetical protein KHA96_00415 [Bacillus sp. FJAT-49711]|nr:hypothetical protein [Bacillus sp. FJAT-49711]MBS4216772.1 hypothetical protein [Bacillus sp. FJAT-49711]